jgi:hypothetical protein
MRGMNDNTMMGMRREGDQPGYEMGYEGDL